MDFIRTCLVILAYVVDVFIGVGILGIAIWLLGKISILPNCWYPVELDINTTAAQRKECWDSLSDEQRKKARGERAVIIVGYTAATALFLLASILAVKVLFPAIIDMAKHI